MQQCLTMLIGLRSSSTEGTQDDQIHPRHISRNDFIQTDATSLLSIIYHIDNDRAIENILDKSNHHSGILRPKARGRVKLETLPQVVNP